MKWNREETLSPRCHSLSLHLRALQHEFKALKPMVQSQRRIVMASRWLAGVVLYIVVAIVTTWPLVRTLDSRLVVGTEVARTVPMFNAWTIWWNADRALHGFGGYWDAPIFYPTTNTFAFSEPQPMTLVVAPLIWAGLGPIVAANVYLLLALVFNGWFAERLLRTLGCRAGIAVGGGVAMVLLPVVHWQIGVLQLVPLWAILWVFWVLLRVVDWGLLSRGVIEDRSGESALSEEGRTTTHGMHRWRWLFLGAEFGLAFSAVMMTCVHHALFLGLILCVVLPFLGRAWLRPATLGSFGIAAVVVLLVCGPMLWHLREMTHQGDFTRPRDTVGQLSLIAKDFASVYGRTWIEANEKLGRPYWFMNPGWFKSVLAVIGIGVGLLAAIRFPQRNELADKRLWIWTRLMIVAVVASVAFSLGPHLQIGNWQPWWWVADWVPGFAQVRNVFRFGYFFQIFAVLLAAQGTQALLSTGGRFLGRKIVRCVICLAALWAALDPWPPALSLADAPDLRKHEDWVQFLRDETLPGNPRFENAIFCVPVASGSDVRDFEVTTEWMLLSSGHGKWLVNGYSGFFPASYFSVRNEFLRDGFTNNFVERLRSKRVRYLVIDRSRYELPWEDQWHWESSEVNRVFRGRSGIDVYELGP